MLEQNNLIYNFGETVIYSWQRLLQKELENFIYGDIRPQMTNVYWTQQRHYITATKIYYCDYAYKFCSIYTTLLFGCVKDSPWLHIYSEYS